MKKIIITNYNTLENFKKKKGLICFLLQNNFFIFSFPFFKTKKILLMNHLEIYYDDLGFRTSICQEFLS